VGISLAPVAGLPDHLKLAPVGREPLPRAVREEHQRQRTLTAAAAAFAERGYNETTVDDIVAAARIGIGSFYALFSGKEECVLALHDRVVSDARERATAALPDDGTWSERFRAGLRALLESHPDIDAVFCSSDMVALGVLTEARILGIDVPGKLAVVGLGDHPFAADLYPALTTVRIDGRAMGDIAARFLIDRIAGNHIPEIVRDIGFTIVERDSA
jgi:AcrR family transcriptional regulator